jgi:hypothetical protein
MSERREGNSRLVVRDGQVVKIPGDIRVPMSMMLRLLNELNRLMDIVGSDSVRVVFGPAPLPNPDPNLFQELDQLLAREDRRTRV